LNSRRQPSDSLNFKAELTLLVAVFAIALFGMGCSFLDLDKDLVAYCQLNGNAKDESGNGNDGKWKVVVLMRVNMVTKTVFFMFLGAITRRYF